MTSLEFIRLLRKMSHSLAESEEFSFCGQNVVNIQHPFSAPRPEKSLNFRAEKDITVSSFPETYLLVCLTPLKTCTKTFRPFWLIVRHDLRSTCQMHQFINQRLHIQEQFLVFEFHDWQQFGANYVSNL